MAQRTCPDVREADRDPFPQIVVIFNLPNKPFVCLVYMNVAEITPYPFLDSLLPGFGSSISFLGLPQKVPQNGWLKQLLLLQVWRTVF